MDQTPVSPTSDDVVSSQKSLPSSQDSGWNDPPQRALSMQHSSYGTSTKRFLNKRVAFPLSPQASAEEKACSPSPSMIPPILQSSVTPNKTLASISRDSVTNSSKLDFDKDRALTEILDNLGSVMTQLEVEKNKVEEIQRRLDNMRSNWIEGKLNDTIQQNILDMSQALARKDIEQADKIHIALLTQYAAACRVWMPAIRHIILELKKESTTKLERSQLSPFDVQAQQE